jgi:acetyltransferase-like isoleucine patch superfamily enzyme
MAIFLNLRRFAYILLISGVNFLLAVVPFNTFRLLILKILRVKLGRNVIVKRGVHLDFPWRLSIGDNCHIGNSVYLDCRGGLIKIGSNSDISDGALIYTLSHDIQSTDFGLKSGDVVIGERNWICARAIILPGARMGVGNVLGANSVFSGVVTNFTLLIGNPAQPVKNLNPTRASNVRNW